MTADVENLRGVLAVIADAATYVGPDEDALMEAHATVAALLDELTEMRADALRYRWLRDATTRDWCISRDAPRGGVVQYVDRDLDARIDDEIDAKPAVGVRNG